ncbi:MAG: hypothetical protein IIZ06_09035 [Kiritimatiellae bacterium]|nr:hypothetical protein [Kiritimatiellia bacterium]
MNKRLPATIAALLCLGLFAADPAAPVPPEAPEPPAAPEAPATPEADAPEEGSAELEEDVDEVDLEDDSAIAARRPKVTGDLKDGTQSLVDIECDEATLADILRQFRKTTGANIISDDSTNLQRRVSVSLRRVPWFQGMTAILGSRGFRIEERENIYRVVEDKQLVPVTTRTFTLNHASAQELADLFNTTYATKDSNGKIKSPIATCFVGANVVVVTASDKVLADCEAIIKAVDKAIAQIYIEARFLELSSEAMHKLGVMWNQLESWGVTAKGFQAGWENNYGRVAKYGTTKEKTMYTPKEWYKETDKEGQAKFTDISSGKSAVDYVTQNYVLPDALNEAPGAGRSAASMAWANASGFSGQLSAEDFKLALSAFESFGEGRIFSNPKVIVSNGKEANVDMTTKFPNVKLTSQRNNSDYGSYLDMSAQLEQIQGDKDKGLFAGSCFFEWGITLTVKPRISPDGLISVEITPTISQLDYDSSQDGSGFYAVQSDTSFGLFPIISMKRITTDFTMKDGSTAVIGGLSRTTEEDVDNGIPYLRKIPWIGQSLFGWKSRQKVQKEIIVCVTIGIANPAELPKDIGLPKNAIMGREYIEGRKLEPGDHESSALEALKLDLRNLDDRKDDTPGTVTITPAS